MTLENKLEVKENSRLKRFLNKIKTKVAPYVLASAAAISAMPGCSGGGGSNPPPAPTNSAPNFTSTPVTSVWEGNSYNYDADAADPEGDNPLVYSLVTAPSWASIDSNTGIVSGTPTGYSANTPENFIVRAAD
ncbi:MAG: Ig domain-containing protein, partial [Candidatus Nanoarchaeia archaeon]|nr:Ig domain-containing protein [Candidatus Nanoarchaeia archaeon]